MDSAVLGAVITSGAAFATGIFTLILNLKSAADARTHNRRTITEIRASEQRKQLAAGLQELLVPVYSHLTAMQAIFRIFTANKGKEFRTLIFLLDPESYKIDGQKVVLSDSDKMLLQEIVSLSKQVEELLLLKGGLVDDPVLNGVYIPDPIKTDVSAEQLKGLSLFSLAIAHFRVFRLAYEGTIKGEVDRYKNFVYPKELNERVYAAIQRTQQNLANLSSSL